MSRYLVTGGAGFIGSHIVDALLERGHDVRVLDNLSTGQLVNLEHVANRVDFREGDILDAKALGSAMEGVAGVFHEAALPSVPRSVEDPIGSHDNNATGTLRVLDAARAVGAKVVYAGSSSCYGDSETLPKHEGMPVQPQSPYAAAKVTGEHYLNVFARCYDMQTVTVRYFNVFGPRQRADSPYSGVIAKFCMNALAGKPCRLDGDGLQSRDFTYVADVARGNLLAMETDVRGGLTVNLAGGSRYSLLDLLHELGELTGGPIEHEFGPVRAGDVKHSQASVDLVKERLGFETQVSFRDGLSATLDWYRDTMQLETASGSPNR